jgi:mannose-6-phosphate isomerase-like protein (cupin superfamily)
VEWDIIVGEGFEVKDTTPHPLEGAPKLLSLIAYAELEPGKALDEHPATGEEFHVIVEGTGEIVVAGETEPVRAGDVVFCPPGAQHSLANTGSDTLRYFIVEVGKKPSR